MSKAKRKAPTWWSKHKKFIWNERQKITALMQKNYESKTSDLSKGRYTWRQYQNKQMQIELARLMQNTKSASELMRLSNDRSEMILTFTIASPYRVTDTDKSFQAVMDRIVAQADSLVYHIRTLSKSTVFTNDETKECAYKKRLHYHWALELQTSGDVHMHTVVSLYNDIEELARLIQLVHNMRNNHLEPIVTRRDKKYPCEIYPLGRTHFALSEHLKSQLIQYYRMKNIRVVTMADKENHSRTNYFIPSLSPKINIYSGTGTLLEFNDNKTLTEKYDSLRKYIISMTRAKFKLKTVQESVSNAQRAHNLKGKFEGQETRAAEDIAVFEYLGLKLHSSSQMLFSKDLYQKVRKQLIGFKSRYKSLAQVTVDWCKGILEIEGKSPHRIIKYRNEIIALEPSRKNTTIDTNHDESINEYQLAKEGM